MSRIVIIISLVIAVGSSAAETLDPKTLLANGRYYERYTGDLNTARQYYTRALNHKGGDEHVKSQARLGLAACASREGKTDEAMELITAALKSRPNEITTLLNHRRPTIGSATYTPSPPIRIDPKADLVRRKLEEVVIKKISFVDTKVTTVFEFLKNQSRKQDPNGEGVGFLVVLASPSKKGGETEGELQGEPPNKKENDEAEPTITMDFDNIPLGQAIRYVCEQADLNYHVGEHVVKILGKGVVPYPLKTRVFTVEPNAFEDMPDVKGDSKTARFRAILERVGVEFPTTASGDKSYLAYDAPSKTLCVRNTPENLHLIDKLTRRMGPMIPHQIRLTTELWELDVDARILERVRLEDVPAFIKDVPNNRKNCLGALSVSGSDKTQISGNETSRSTAFGQACQLNHQTTGKVTVSGDNLTMAVDLDWRYQAWDPKLAPAGEAGKAGGPPIWSSTVKKTFSIWDGESFVVALAPPRPQDKRGAIYLIVSTRILSPDGVSIRDNTEPKGGWIKVPGSATEKANTLEPTP